VGVDQVVGQQGIQRGDILLGHGVHAFSIKVNELLPVVGHRFLFLS
jgi:hypothetical protein